MYANGYKPNDPAFGIDANVSTVLNGEEYQRVECGYGYWLRPEGMPRIFTYPWYGGSDAMFDRDTGSPNQTLSISQGSSDYFVSVAPYTNGISYGDFEDGKRIQLEMGSAPSIKEGSLDIYRIVDPSPQNLVQPDPTPIPQFVKIKFQKFYSQRGRSSDRLKVAVHNSANNQEERFWSDDGDGNQLTKNTTKLKITNRGVIDVTIGGFITLQPNQSYDLANGVLGDFNNMEMVLPCNSLFDFEEFKYKKARYDMEWVNITLYKSNLSQDGEQFFSRAINPLNLNGGNENNPPKYYLITRLANVRTNYNDGSGWSSSGCKDHWVSGSKGQHTVAINGMALVSPSQNKGDWYDSYFSSSILNTFTCDNGVDGLIPFKVE